MSAQCISVVCTHTQPSPSCRPGTHGPERLRRGLFWTWHDTIHLPQLCGKAMRRGLLIKAGMHEIRAELLGSQALRQAIALLGCM